MTVVVPDHEDAHAIAYDPVEEMIGETFEVDPPQVEWHLIKPILPQKAPKIPNDSCRQGPYLSAIRLKSALKK